MNAVARTIDRTDTDTRLLTADEVQQRLGIGRDALREQCRLGLPCIRVGKYRRFHWPTLLAWLNTKGD